MPPASSLARRRGAARPVKPRSDGRRHSVRVIEIGASVLQAVGRLGDCATLSEIAAHARLPASKAHRYLKAWSAAGFVEQDTATSQYRLGVEALSLGLAALAGLDIVSTAMPHIGSLCARVNETVILSIWGTHGPTVVQVREPPRRVTVVTRLGSVLPLLSSATGLVFAAYLAPEKLRGLRAAETGTVAGAGRAPAAANAKRLREIRRAGLATVHGLFFPGIDAIAAPVFDATARTAAVIAVLGPSAGFDASADGAIARELTAATAAVSARLGYRIP